jgi:NADPH:quinone reductase-like Zn-dependent oxidoreductase
MEEYMKAVLNTSYGPPDMLRISEVEKPTPKENEILIRVRAASVTSSDCNIRNLTFVPKYLHFPMKMEFGFKEPKNKILGFDVAGDIEEMGSQVTRFRVGDQIFGTTEPYYGAHAEYVCLPEDTVLAPKPNNMSYEEAGTVPVIGNTALHFVRDLGAIQPGQKILINGASGGIGTFAVQIAKNLGAEVTGVCSTRNLDLVRSLGADHVIDYTQEDFTKSGEIYDVIFDAVGKSSFSRCKGSLNENGLYLNTLPKFSVFMDVFLTSLRGGKKVKMEGAPALIENLMDLKEMIEAGKLKTVIDKTYPLEEIAEAFRYVEGGHKSGNVAITVES